AAARLLCESVLGALLDTTASQGIEVLVLKGAALAHDLYPRPELRPYGDLDILCRPADFPRLATALLEAGYRREDPNDAAGLRPPLDSSRRRNFIDPLGGVLIEVHLDVLGLGLPARRREDFWREARTLEIGRLRVRALSPTHQLLHLAIHVHAHCYSRLLWLIDLDLLIRRQGETIEWDRLPALGRGEGVGTVLRHALATTHAILSTPIPPLPPPTAGERLLAICYRLIWPLEKVRRLERSEHLRLLRFQPGTGDPRDLFYSLLLLGRRREKWRAWRHHARTSG
ncbi:MAG TPA: nucleotidyltransferase family protein, partial [Chloroflexota bacterium]|nr:nucleotidyltransferase family protein [Chloroflexota bacterium]